MFKAIIDRDEGLPWPQTGMTSDKWLDIPVQDVIIGELVATQDGVYFHGLNEEYVHWWGDVFPHVICWNGDMYLDDGHHRAVKARLRGEFSMLARVLVL